MRGRRKTIKLWQMQRLTDDRKLLFEVAWKMSEDKKMLGWAGVWFWLHTLTYSQKRMYLRMTGVMK